MLSTSLKRFILIVILLSIALLWGELFTRILLPQNVDSQMNINQPDDVIGLIYTPNAIAYEKGREYNVRYKINSIGLRDREYGPKKSGEFRVLLLGDSFAVSHGLTIDNSLSRQLEKSLQSVADRDDKKVKIEVINAARNGNSPYNYWKAYIRWKKILTPDIVVVAMSPDDYDSSNAYMHYIVKDGNIVSMYKDDQQAVTNGINYTTKLRKWLSWNSEFYILLRNFLYYNNFMGQINLWMNKRNTQNDLLQPYIVPQSEILTRSWAESFKYIKQLKEETRKDGLRLIIIPVPRKLEISSEEYRQILTANNLPPHQFDNKQPLRQIAVFCHQENIPLLDPRAALHKLHVEIPCYFVYDGHWNAEGIHVAAESIAIQWQALKLPPWNNDASK